MASANVELVRRSVASVNAGELEAAMEFLAPDIEWVVAREHPEARTIVGHQALAEYLGVWEEMMPKLAFELDRLLDSGEVVVAIGSVRGIGTSSGVEIAVPIAFIYTFEHGRAVRVEEYLDPREALKAAGVES